VTALDTGTLARSHAPRPDLVLRMQGIALVGVFLRVTRFAEDAGFDRAGLLAAVGTRLRRFYGKRGDDVIAANLEVVAAAYDGVIDVSQALGLPHGVERSLAVTRPRAMTAVPA
jgi:pyruvate-ferredoxin/flavodoxin oxidoreductase